MKLTSVGILLTLLPLVFMFADDPPKSASPDGYAYGFTSCFKGSEGTGIRLRLTPRPGCDSHTTYPYLEIHIGEPQVPTNQRLVIGDTYSAFRCEKSKSACEWAVSGELMFNHFEDVDKKGIHTDGWYELRFAHGLPETGRFKADCIAPCG